ncbi:MAG: S8 family serine peptidase, partial [Candidatus Aenigmarchaeota archaeon]|nr:S8 family serine peptidase [Candidatus Aenigmarchaeota archaeon]
LDNAEYGGINMEAAWDISTGSNDVIVAVLDTGVAYETYDKYVIAPDLASTCFVSGYDFVNNDDHPNDDAGHGTHVTGTIAQNTNNSLGVAGVAFDTCIMPVKVLNKRGSGTYDMIANGIYFAANNGADIISMSLSGSIASTTLENALAHAYGKGVTIIASSGNNGPEKVGYPAAYDEYVIAVGATRYDEARAPYSSYYSDFEDPVIRNYVDITAPGGDMGVDQNEDGYGDGVLQQTHNGRNYGVFGYYFYQGTSMAAPHVAGVAALIMANNIATTPDDVRYVLEFTAEDKNVSGWDPQYGYGIVDAYAALNYNPTPVDNDGDTYYSDVDCNDSNASIHPNAIEICNGVDDNCNGTIDEGFDLDNDGYTSCGGDCNDSDLTINPEAPETSCDGIDNDCDSLIDEGYISYTCGIGACEAPSVCTSGEVYCIEGSPIDEVCGDGIDNDCDGETDEDCEPIEVCGDGAVQSPNSDGFSEECDGSDLGGNTCDDLSGYDSGTLSCNQDCTYNTNSCTLCGDCFKDVCDGVCHPRKENSVSCSDCW